MKMRHVRIEDVARGCVIDFRISSLLGGTWRFAHFSRQLLSSGLIGGALEIDDGCMAVFLAGDLIV